MSQAEKQRTPPRMLHMCRSQDLTPHLRRIVLSGPALQGFPANSAGEHIKLLLPQAHQRVPVLPSLGPDGPIWPAAHERPISRTYTVAAFDANAGPYGELAVDFVLHGENGPASRWALHAQVGDAIGIAGPAAPPRFLPQADYFLLIGDASAFAMIAACLAELPTNARGMVLLEVANSSHMCPMPHPPGIKLQWLMRHTTAPSNSRLLLAAVQSMPWPRGEVSVTLAGESHQVVALRKFLMQQRGLGKHAMYAVPYWKDEHSEEQYHAERHQIMDELLDQPANGHAQEVSV